jgi:hypothetical protein
MTALLEKTPLRLGSRRVHGRAVNAVAELLRQRLVVPEIYIDPKIPGVSSPDVLGVDQAGSGDLHAVEVKAIGEFQTRAQLRLLLSELKNLPFHYKYLALPSFASDLTDPHLRFAEYPELFDEDGIGRVGIISFDRRILEASAVIDKRTALLTVPPERFRVRGDKLAAVEKFLLKAKPDMSVRL